MVGGASRGSPRLHWLPISSMSSVCYALEHKTLTFDLGVKHANCTQNLTRRPYRKCHFRYIYIDDIRAAITAGVIEFISYTDPYALFGSTKVKQGFP